MRITQPDRELLKKFVAAHAPSLTGDILDVGGAGGRYKGFFKNAKTYRVLDPDTSQHPDIVGTAEEIPLPDRSIDAIVCTQVLGDVWDLPKAISEMARILRPGGSLLITESLMNELHDEPHDYWRITPQSWIKLLSPAFDIDLLEARGGYFSMKTQNAIRRMIEKYRLYDRPLLGRMMNILASFMTRAADARDSREDESLRRKFAIGFNILAKKKAS